MKKIIIAVCFVAVAAGAFFLGRASNNPDFFKCPFKAAQEQPAVEAPKPAPQPAQQPQGQVQAQRQQAPGGDVFPVSPMSDKPVARQIDIPAGTKPARDASPSRGPKDAPVVFMVISDFQCPVCKRAHEGLASLATDFPDKVRYVFKQNPLEMHRDAMNAAAASMAAGRQGRFWEFADALFANQRALSESDLMDQARKLQLDMERFKKDYEDPALRQRAKTEGGIAMDIGARGTPAFLVNGKLQVGWASYGSVKQQVENELAAVEALTATGMSVAKAREERVRTNLPEHEKLLNTPLGIEFSDR